MTYKSLDDKIRNLSKKIKDGKVVRIPLPIKILENISKTISLQYISIFPPEINSEHKRDEFILKNISEFYLELSSSKRHDECTRRYYFNLSDKRDTESRVRITLGLTDLYDPDKVDLMCRESFEEIKPGTLLVAAQPNVFLLKDFAKIFIGGFEHTDWDAILDEGEMVLAIDKQKIEDLIFVKVLHKSQTFWAFGPLFITDFYSSKKSDNHHFI